MKETEIALPKTFVYETKKLRSLRFRMLVPIFLATSFLGLVLSPYLAPPTVMVSRLLNSLREFSSYFGWPMAALYTLIGIVGFAFGPLIFGSSFLTTWSRWRGTKQRIHQRITATERGLTFEDQVVFIEVAWNEISEYIWQSPSLANSIMGLNVVKTGCGDFDFIATISEYEVLRKLLYQRVTLPQQQKKYVSVAGDERIFRYRSEENREVFRMRSYAVFYHALPASLFILGLMGQPFVALAENGDISLNLRLPAVFCSLLLPGLFLVWWPYFRTEIRINETGIARRGLLGETFIAWRDVREYSQGKKSRHYDVCSDKKRIRFWMMITNAEQLKNEIAHRATHAEKRGWEAPNEGKSAATSVSDVL